MACCHGGSASQQPERPLTPRAASLSLPTYLFPSRHRDNRSCYQSSEPHEPNGRDLQRLQIPHVRWLRYGTILERRRPAARAEVCNPFTVWGTIGLSLLRVRRRASRAAHDARVQSAPRVYLTMIKLGVRLMFVIIILFALAYFCLISALLYSFHRWRKHLDQDAIPGLDTEACVSPPAE